MPGELFPTSPDEVCDCVRWALAQSKTLELVGNGTKRAIGNPVAADTVLSFNRLTGIICYEPHELVMTAWAGTPIDEITAALAAHRQCLAFEPPRGALANSGSESDCGTIGGIVLANLAGSRRFRAGSARDHLLGFEAVNGRGEFFKSGGTVVKNVTGYDLCKLIAGSWGTLAAVTRLSFRVMPSPQDAATVLLPAPSRSDALALMLELAQQDLEFSGLACWPATQVARLPLVLPSVAGFWIAARLEGTTRSIDERCRLATRKTAATDLHTLDAERSASLWTAIGCGAAFAFPVVLKLAAPPREMDTLIADLAADMEWLIDNACGWLWIGMNSDSAPTAISTLRERLRRCGGHLTALRAPQPLRDSLACFEPQSPAVAQLSERIREAFDPRRIFNPGRMYRQDVAR